jgi:hypothetical protein
LETIRVLRRGETQKSKTEKSKTAPLKTKGCGTPHYFRALISVVRRAKISV